MELKLKEFKKSLEGFSYLVKLDLKEFENTLDKRIIDGIENGMIQKFKYTIELCWKMIKKFLIIEAGIDSKTPKQSIKDFFLAGFITENRYLTLIEMINDRNKLSHIYDEKEFKAILRKFPEYTEVFEEIDHIISKKIV